MTNGDVPNFFCEQPHEVETAGGMHVVRRTNVKLRKRNRVLGELVQDLLAEVEMSTRYKRQISTATYHGYLERAHEAGVKEMVE